MNSVSGGPPVEVAAVVVRVVVGVREKGESLGRDSGRDRRERVNMVVGMREMVEMVVGMRESLG